jgi:hypothetical protein
MLWTTSQQRKKGGIGERYAKETEEQGAARHLSAVLSAKTTDSLFALTERA